MSLAVIKKGKSAEFFNIILQCVGESDLPSYLFILCIQLLCIEIRSNSNIERT